MADQDSIQAAEELDMEVALATGPDGLAEQQQQSSWWSWLGWTAQKPKFVKIPDVPYPSMTGVAHPKHKVDIYIPSSKPATTGDAAQKWPVLVHCHGGGWVRGMWLSCEELSRNRRHASRLPKFCPGMLHGPCFIERKCRVSPFSLIVGLF